VALEVEVVLFLIKVAVLTHSEVRAWLTNDSDPEDRVLIAENAL
jgi:hypothetical protein